MKKVVVPANNSDEILYNNTPDYGVVCYRSKREHEECSVMILLCFDSNDIDHSKIYGFRALDKMQQDFLKFKTSDKALTIAQAISRDKEVLWFKKIEDAMKHYYPVSSISLEEVNKDMMHISAVQSLIMLSTENLIERGIRTYPEFHLRNITKEYVDNIFSERNHCGVKVDMKNSDYELLYRFTKFEGNSEILGWNDLMPIIVRLATIKFNSDPDEPDSMAKYIYPITFGAKDEEGLFMVRFNRMSLFKSDTLINATYQACLEIVREILTNSEEFIIP